MSQEPKAKSFAFRSAFNDARNVRHHEGSKIPVGNDAQVRCEGGEGIIGDLRFGCRENRKQGGFPRIGKAHEPDICQQLQFDEYIAFFAFFSALGEPWSLPRGALEVHIAQTSAATF